MKKILLTIFVIVFIQLFYTPDATAAPVRRCGDDICGATENINGCPQDCDSSTAVCGNGTCDYLDGENRKNCQVDCRANVCRNGICGAGENPFICEEDCGEPRCGDGICGQAENIPGIKFCPADCTGPCGDGICGEFETLNGCPQDCDAIVDPNTCGNLTCEPDLGENAKNCDECKSSYGVDPCGNGVCTIVERGTCFDDCNVPCGDGVCRFDEDDRSCPQDCATLEDLQDQLPGADPFKGCSNDAIDTALGCLPTDPQGFVETIFPWALGIAGTAAFLLIAFGAFTHITARGNPEQIQKAREIITSAVAGLVIIIFSVLLLQIIGVNILKIPGLGSPSPSVQLNP